MYDAVDAHVACVLCGCAPGARDRVFVFDDLLEQYDDGVIERSGSIGRPGSGGRFGWNDQDRG